MRLVIRTVAPALSAFLVLPTACLEEGDENSSEFGVDDNDDDDTIPVSTIVTDTLEERVDFELSKLSGVTLHAPPTHAQIDALVANGFPKPASSDPAVKARAKHAHETLMAWGFDALHPALQAATSKDPAVVRKHALALRNLLLVWVNYGTWLGDRKDQANYGNLSLELTWFLGNVARAAAILDALSATPGSGATGVWTATDHTHFLAWAKKLVDNYIDFEVFASGQSNRRASQIETMLRVAELEPNEAARKTALSELHGRLRTLLTNAIQDNGFIPEDTCRDKYHEQFFLASALQARHLLTAHGLPLDAQDDAQAVSHLLAATSASATRNMNSNKPAVCGSMSNTTPNYEIPLWALTPSLFADYGRALPGNVATMLDIQYEKSNVDLVMQWGYNAISLKYELGGNIRASRRRGIVEAEAFIAAGPGTDVVSATGVGGGKVIGNIAAGETWDYSYSVPSPGTRPVQLLVSAPAGATLELSIVTTKEYLKATVQVPANNSYRWIVADVNEPNVGTKTLRVRAKSGGFTLDALRFAP